MRAWIACLKESWLPDCGLSGNTGRIFLIFSLAACGKAHEASLTTLQIKQPAFAFLTCRYSTAVCSSKILGISNDGGDSHRSFVAKYKLPYTLLSDTRGAVRKLYGVRATFGVIPGRMSFVIDREGILRGVHNSQFHPETHVAEALKAL